MREGEQVMAQKKKPQRSTRVRNDMMRREVYRSHQSSQGEKQYAEITIAALTGEVSAEHVYDPPVHPYRCSTSRIRSLEDALDMLAEGGYVIDLRPLADHPCLITWVYQSPLPNGRIEGDEIQRLSLGARQFAGDMIESLQGEYQQLALLAANRVGEPIDGSAGPFDSVSASYRAAYWGSRGAGVGKRSGNVLRWSDGSQQIIGHL